MKKTRTLVVVLVFVMCVIGTSLLCTEVFAETSTSGTCGENLTWLLDDKGTLTISGTGKMDNYGGKNPQAPWGEICQRIKKVVLEDGVTSIGERAFEYCTELEQVTIPASVTQFGEGAFWSCYEFSDVFLTDLAAWCAIDFESAACNPLSASKNLFVNGRLVTDLVVPDGVTRIGSYAFAGYDHLLCVTLPESVTSIDDYAFYHCKNLNKVTLSDNITSIGAFAFYECSALNNISIPNSINLIKEGAFRDCCLREVYISDLTVWCAIQFESGDSNPVHFAGKLYLDNVLLTDLVIPDGITNIAKYAFYGCDSITTLTIPDGVTNIGASAFSGCESISGLTISNSVTTIESFAFSTCTSLINVEIPDSVTHIGAAAFHGCTSLASVTIPNSVNSIGASALRGCTSLAKVILPDSIKKIPAWMFDGCFNLSVVVIPESVTRIERDAFSNCNNLWHVLYEGTKSQWGKITIEQSVGGSAACLGNAHRHYNYNGSKNVNAYYKEPTCLADGERTLSCELCDIYQTDVLSKYENMHYGNCWVSVDENYHKFICAVCATESTENHQWNRGTITKVATCTETGEMTYTCNTCFATKTEVIEMVTHRYSYWTVMDDEFHKRICTVCGMEETESHRWDMGKATIQETCTTEGEKVYTCTVCDVTKTESIAEKGHNYRGKATKPTCTEQGYTTYTCSRCKDSYQDDYVDATGHSYSAWTEVKAPTLEEAGSEERKCEVCGNAEQRDVSNLEPEPTNPEPTQSQSTEPKPTKPHDDTAEDKDGSSSVIIVTVVAIVIAGGVVAIVLMKKKK